MYNCEISLRVYKPSQVSSSHSSHLWENMAWSPVYQHFLCLRKIFLSFLFVSIRKLFYLFPSKNFYIVIYINEYIFGINIMLIDWAYPLPSSFDHLSSSSPSVVKPCKCLFTPSFSAWTGGIVDPLSKYISLSGGTGAGFREGVGGLRQRTIHSHTDSQSVSHGILSTATTL